MHYTLHVGYFNRLSLNRFLKNNLPVFVHFWSFTSNLHKLNELPKRQHFMKAPSYIVWDMFYFFFYLIIYHKSSEFDSLILVNLNYTRNSRCSFKALKVQAARFKKDGVPVYGLGLQGHFSSHNIDMDVLKVTDLH